jgi:hypothetical protein
VEISSNIERILKIKIGNVKREMDFNETKLWFGDVAMQKRAVE